MLERSASRLGSCLWPLVASMWVACGVPDDSRCSVGRSVACTCETGASGAQACREDGTYGPCTCGGGDASVAFDAAAALDGGDPTDAGSPTPHTGPLRVFTTSLLYHADRVMENCQVVADVEGLGGTWAPWVSTSERDAIDTIRGDGPWVDLEGRVLFETRAQFQTVPFEKLLYDETGYRMNEFPQNSGVWTGTGAGGRDTGRNCADWTSTRDDLEGTIGQYNSAERPWTESDTIFRCDQLAHIYCIEQPPE